MRGTKRMARLPRSILRPMLATLSTRHSTIPPSCSRPNGTASASSPRSRAAWRAPFAQRQQRHQALSTHRPGTDGRQARRRFDGELVALDNQGRSRFQLLQDALGINPAAGCVTVSSTCVSRRSSDLRRMPLSNASALLPSVSFRAARCSASADTSSRIGVSAFRAGAAGAGSRASSPKRAAEALLFRAADP